MGTPIRMHECVETSGNCSLLITFCMHRQVLSIIHYLPLNSNQLDNVFEGASVLGITAPSVRLTCLQHLMLQQQRNPQGFGLIMEVRCSLACRCKKYFLLCSVFVLQARNRAAVSRAEKHDNAKHARTHTHTQPPPRFVPFGVEVHQSGHVVANAGFQHNTVFICLPMNENTYIFYSPYIR